MPAAPEEGGPRNWRVTATTDLFARPDPSSGSVARYSVGTVLDNLGCQLQAGIAWCDVQKLGGGPRGYVRVDVLQPAVSPSGSVATGPDDSALRAGQGQFDATGRIPCAQFLGQPTTPCAFGVARAGGGYATVVVTKPDRRTRALFFRMGQAIGADTSEADPGDFSTRRESDLTVIRVGNERYEIPDAVVLGG